MVEQLKKMRVDLLCTGLDHIRRGYESFARECFDALKTDDWLDIRLYKGSGEARPGERSLMTARRDSHLAGLLARITQRSEYHVEQMGFLLSYLAGPLRRDPPQVILTSDANLANFLSRWRKRFGGKYRILFSNGGPVSPPFPEYDHVQQVALPYYEQALQAGETKERLSLVPYGITTNEDCAAGNFPDKATLRRKLGLLNNRKIVLSVGYVSAQHKRMDHVVREVGTLPPAERPFLLLLGQQDESTESIRLLARDILGEQGFRIASVPYEQITDYYLASDVFVLASLKEGFGRVLLEASSYGLPCILDDNPVMRYVLGELGCYVGMAATGDLAQAIVDHLDCDEDAFARQKRAEEIKRRFSWDSLRDDYVAMFRRCAGQAS